MGKNRDDGGPWSDLNHDLLSLVMMKLEAIDFHSFSGVCKPWRSLALPNKSMFMASRPPMALWITERPNKRKEYSLEKKEYSLEDLGGKMFKIRLPKSGSRTCVGLTCGYLVFSGIEPRDFLLMNPIKRHAIRFPNVPRNLVIDQAGVRAILVFSPSRSAWVFVVLSRFTSKIWFSTAGKREWGYCSLNSGIIDLHEFKGKIYAVDMKSRLYEVKLDPRPKLTLLKTKNTLRTNLMYREFVSSGENLYAVDSFDFFDEAHRFDFGEMEWVSKEKTMGMEECVFFLSGLKHSAALKPGLWSESDSWLRFKHRRSAKSDTCGNDMLFMMDMWYFPHDCLRVNLKHE